MGLYENIKHNLKEAASDVDIEYVAISDSDPQNENEYFDNKREAIMYAKRFDLDRVIKIDNGNGTEEEVWSKDLDESDIGYDYWGSIIMEPFKGQAYIQYYGGPGHLEYVYKSRNGRYRFMDFSNGDPYVFDSYEDALKVQQKLGGEILSYDRDYLGKDLEESSLETKKERKNIKLDDKSEQAYMNYVKDWMDERNFSWKDELSYWSGKNSDYDISDFKKMFDGLYSENGINGELFVSYDEFLNNEYQMNESSTEDYWDATELDRKNFMALLKFNFGYDSKGNNYIITNDNREVLRFRANTDEDAINYFNAFMNLSRDSFGAYNIEDDNEIRNKYKID